MPSVSAKQEEQLQKMIVGKMSKLSFNGKEIEKREKIGQGVSGHVYKVQDATGKWMAAKVTCLVKCPNVLES